MTFCPECGKPVAPHAKFCRNCGASQLDDVLLVASPGPVAAPLISPAPSPVIPVPPPRAVVPPPPAVVRPVVTQPIAQSLCSACGSPLSPSEKFCGVCGARAGQMAPAPSVPAPAMPVYAPVPAPATAPQSPPLPVTAQGIRQSPGVRTCNTCGNVIKSGDKYCSKCLAIVRDNPSPASSPQSSVPAPNPVYPSSAAAPGSYVCASCGSPITGTEKFCGICGATVVASRVPAPAQFQPQPQTPPPSPPVQKTCPACGTPVSDTTKFCGGCGAPVGGSFRPPEVVPPVPVPAVQEIPGPRMPCNEELIGVIGNARKMKMFGVSWDTYNIVVTRRQMILAQMTTPMLNAAVLEAQQQAKAEGKGFFGIVKDQLTATYQFALRYETMPVEQILAETPGNFSIENSRISAISLKLQGGDSDDGGTREFKMYIESSDGKFEYVIAENERFVNILKEAYSDRLHMPFGYFAAGGVRIKLF